MSPAILHYKLKLSSLAKEARKEVLSMVYLHICTAVELLFTFVHFLQFIQHSELIRFIFFIVSIFVIIEIQ